MLGRDLQLPHPHIGDERRIVWAGRADDVFAHSGQETGDRLRSSSRFPSFDGSVRLIVAKCSAIYSSRLDTVLPEALRLIMVKDDGPILMHADSGGYKPLNCDLTLDRP